MLCHVEQDVLFLFAMQLNIDYPQTELDSVR